VGLEKKKKKEIKKKKIQNVATKVSKIKFGRTVGAATNRADAHKESSNGILLFELEVGLGVEGSKGHGLRCVFFSRAAIFLDNARNAVALSPLLRFLSGGKKEQGVAITGTMQQKRTHALFPVCRNAEPTFPFGG